MFVCSLKYSFPCIIGCLVRPYLFLEHIAVSAVLYKTVSLLSFCDYCFGYALDSKVSVLSLSSSLWIRVYNRFKGTLSALCLVLILIVRGIWRWVHSLSYPFEFEGEMDIMLSPIFIYPYYYSHGENIFKVSMLPSSPSSFRMHNGYKSSHLFLFITNVWTWKDYKERHNPHLLLVRYQGSNESEG